jgi:hypothetical protein
MLIGTSAPTIICWAAEDALCAQCYRRKEMVFRCARCTVFENPMCAPCFVTHWKFHADISEVRMHIALARVMKDRYLDDTVQRATDRAADVV